MISNGSIIYDTITIQLTIFLLQDIYSISIFNGNVLINNDMINNSDYGASAILLFPLLGQISCKWHYYVKNHETILIILLHIFILVQKVYTVYKYTVYSIEFVSISSLYTSVLWWLMAVSKNLCHFNTYKMVKLIVISIILISKTTYFSLYIVH